MHRIPLLLGSLVPIVAGTLLAQDSTPQGGNPPSRVARISFLSGTVSFQPGGDTAWSVATLNYPAAAGDRVYADRGARAELQVGSLTVRLANGADLTVTNLTDQLLQLGLTQGTLRVSVYQLTDSDSVEVDTPRGSLALLAAGEYRIDLPQGDSALVVTAMRGSAQWTEGGVAQTVQSGQAIRVTGVNPIQLANVAPPPSDDFDKWSAERDQRLAAAPSGKYVSRDIPGYDDLDAAGAWQVDGTYGPVWYPTVVVAGWVPYRYGHWVWTERWGWTWVEHERWGWAPFHYGRWVSVRGRWGWLPGPVAMRPCYAPALVVFVDGSSFSGQAWFPLGPGEPYYPWYHHDDDYQRRVNFANVRHVTNITYVTDATYINRITYRYRGIATTAVSNDAFQHRGPIAGRMMNVPAERVAAAPIAAHPFVLPTAGAAAGGISEPRPNTGRRPTFIAAPPPRPERAVLLNKPMVNERQAPNPRAVPTPQPAPEQAVRLNKPLVIQNATPTPQDRPVLITRRPPPPPNVPFAVRQQAMQPDPGRPLEPRQVDNLRAGRPAGPSRDPEYPAHAAAPGAPPAARPVAPRAVPAPRQPSNPPGKPAARPEQKRRP